MFKPLLADERVTSTELAQMEVYNGLNTLPILSTVLEGSPTLHQRGIHRIGRGWNHEICYL